MASTTPEREYVTGIIKSVYESYGFELLKSTDTSCKKQIDKDGKSVEANVILAVNETLKRLGIQNFAIYISHSAVLAGILETVGVPREMHERTFAAIRTFSKFNLDGFLAELQDVGVAEKASTILADLFLKTDEILNQEHEINRTVVSNLLNIVNSETLTELGQILRLTGRTPVLIDPALACLPPYGPGVVIEARTSGLDILGEGGCIDGVTEDDLGDFTFSFDVETLVELIENCGDFSTPIPASNAATVL